jgi:hypothetical protein
MSKPEFIRRKLEFIRRKYIGKSFKYYKVSYVISSIAIRANPMNMLTYIQIFVKRLDERPMDELYDYMPVAIAYNKCQKVGYEIETYFGVECNVKEANDD